MPVSCNCNRTHHNRYDGQSPPAVEIWRFRELYPPPQWIEVVSRGVHHDGLLTLHTRLLAAASAQFSVTWLNPGFASALTLWPLATLIPSLDDSVTDFKNLSADGTLSKGSSAPSLQSRTPRRLVILRHVAQRQRADQHDRCSHTYASRNSSDTASGPRVHVSRAFAVQVDCCS